MKSQKADFIDPQNLRSKAEKLLIEKKDKARLQLQNETDAKKLVHELQVHQIELEMQNEELQKAYQIAETALRDYTLLYDLAPMGYISLESDGTISELNFTAADMLGERRYSLIKSKFKLFVSDESKEVFDGFLKKVFSGKNKEMCDLVLGYDDKPLSHVYLEGIFVKEINKCLLSLVDISHFIKFK
jgi:PAS domain-containing protein